ncbi:MAG: AbrB/MazE/SpoVT family DNA-binding domain-containing protein [Thermoplasmata archaeon]
MKKCPVCEKGTLKTGMIEEEMFGIQLGKYKGEICDGCGESFLSQEAVAEIEEKTKKLGIWGLATKIKVVKSGNSLSVRIPAKFAQFLGLKEGKELLLYAEGKKKIAFEIT